MGNLEGKRFDCLFLTLFTVYDLTEFMTSHPGGEEIILQYGGKDVTTVMDDPQEHLHSDSAYEMMEEYCIGYLEGNDTSSLEFKKDQVKKVKDNQLFIDVTKPMLYQVWTGNFSKEFYLKQVHIPRHTKGTAPLLGGYLEFLTKTPWWVIPIFWAPIVTYCVSKCLLAYSPNVTVAAFTFGLFLWTFIEYSLHRFLFHLDDLLPDHRASLTLHFLLHGVHHFLPMDG